MNWHDRRNSLETLDHVRDLRKHDSLPHRLDRKISTALDIALLCRCLDNIQEAADLIDAYAQMVAAEARCEETAATSKLIFKSMEGPNAKA